MSHTTDKGSAAPPLRDQRGLVHRMRRLHGQVDAIELSLARRGGTAPRCLLLDAVVTDEGFAGETGIIRYYGASQERDVVFD